MSRFSFSSLLLASLALLLSLPSRADIPKIISYQGKVTDTSGNPVPDGNYTMRFRIYDDPTAGTNLWDSGDQTVAVNGGIFSVLLGESPQPAIDLPFDQDYWLWVTFNGVNQTPRQRLTSVGYAYMASGLVPGTEVAGEVTGGTLAAIKGVNTATSGAAYGGWFVTYSTAGYGVYGLASATSGTTFGGSFESSSTNGIGVYAVASATTGSTRGVCGVILSTAGYGVYGNATATTGPAHGVYGQTASPQGRGVYGINTGGGVGVYGEGTNAVIGRSGAPGYGAVYGRNEATSGSGMGIYGRSDSPEGYGVYGTNPSTTGSGCGVYGVSSSTAGVGVYGHATATSGMAEGGYFESSSTDGIGVYGRATATSGMIYGVYGLSSSTAGRGVYGWATATTGTTYGGRFVSSSTGGRGVYAWTEATTGTTCGVYGQSYSTSGYGVYYSGGLAGTGTKSCVVKTSRGPTLMYCQESPENWFEDFGEGQLVNGKCHIELDPLFLETVTIDQANPLHVFLQPNDEACVALVAKKGLTGFDVTSPLNPTASGAFTYRVVAKRKGFEAKRLEYCKAAETDPYLYPELREKELELLEQERAQMEEVHALLDSQARRAERELARRDEELQEQRALEESQRRYSPKVDDLTAIQDE